MTGVSTTSGLRDAMSAMSDVDIAREFGAWLADRRTSLAKADRKTLVAELAMYQELDRRLQAHMNVIAAQAYEGRHPKHWLWKSHKQFILERVRAGDRVLDVGCGASAYLLWMAEKGAEVTAIDNRPEPLELARSIMRHPNLRFEQRDAVRDAPAQPYDVVICSHVIEHIDEPVALLRALGAWAPRLIVAVPPEDSRWQKVMFRDLGLLWKDDEDHRREYTPALLREQIEQAGWRITEMHAGIDIKCVAEKGSA